MGGTSYATNNDQTSQIGLVTNTIYEGPVNEAELFESNLGGSGDHLYQFFQVRGGIVDSSSVKLTLSETFDVFSDSKYRYEVNEDDQTHAWATYAGSPWKTADSTGITIDDADGINIFVALRGETSGVVSDMDVMTLKCIWEQDTSVYATYQFVGTVGTICFAAGTPILMADNSEVPIEMLKEGDKIVTLNTKTQQLESSEITKFVNPFHDGIVEYVFEDGRTITATTDHPLWVWNKEGWASYDPGRAAKMGIFTYQIEVGDECLYLNDEKQNRLKITEIKPKEEGFAIRTYGMPQLSKNKNYFANSILVHNESV
jgi:hypothetical protein